jgi:hypothetical protein
LTTKHALLATLIAAASLCCGVPEIQFVDASAPSSDAAVPCVAHTEICNGMDDDCDGLPDEGHVIAGVFDEAALDCKQRVAHAETVCAKGQCVNLGCDRGYTSCDGHPENGCECKSDGGESSP